MKMIKKYIIISLFSSTLIYAQTNDNVLTLQDAVDMAIEKNISIKQSELNLQNSELGSLMLSETFYQGFLHLQIINGILDEELILLPMLLKILLHHSHQ